MSSGSTEIDLGLHAVLASARLADVGSGSVTESRSLLLASDPLSEGGADTSEDGTSLLKIEHTMSRSGGWAMRRQLPAKRGGLRVNAYSRMDCFPPTTTAAISTVPWGNINKKFPRDD